MAFQARWDVYKITEWRDNCVYKTKKLTSIWLDVGKQTDEQKIEIAKQHGGDMLAPTVDSRIV